ncbi:pyridoxamine 5'-phosphate oxidase family protein [Nonomuraea sp. NPDC046802]|uniref:pyridoxamine 5'-phosphate oxidase family protein n=1 Tax=Nonomuraea sp. NPDC046802 TaxID=3154919 RepID=UPI0033D95F2F
MQHQVTPPASASRELSRDEGLRFRRNVTFGRIVFISRATPAIRVVSHAMDGVDLLLGLPYESEINALLTHTSPVVYQADLLDAATRLGWSVVLSGRAGLVEDPEEVEHALRRLRPWPGERIDVVVRIHPELVTGFHVAEVGAGGP